MKNKNFSSTEIIGLSIFTLAFLFVVGKGLSPVLPTSDEISPRSNERNIQNKPCEGYTDCSFEVREYLEGAGWQLAGDVLYYGNGVHYAVGAKPMETGVKQIYYTMDCDCQPKDVKFK